MGQGQAAERHASWHLAADVEAHAAEGIGRGHVDLAHGVRAGSEQRAAHSQLGNVQAWREESREQCHTESRERSRTSRPTPGAINRQRTFPERRAYGEVPGAHVVAVTAPPGDRVGAAVSVVTLVIR